MTYTPAPIQGGFLTQFTTNYSKYALFQKTCICQQKITITGAGGAVANQAILLNLPFSAVNTLVFSGSFYYFDSGTANYAGTTTGNSAGANYVQLMVSSFGQVGANPALTVAAGDSVQFTCSFEVA